MHHSSAVNPSTMSSMEGTVLGSGVYSSSSGDRVSWGLGDGGNRKLVSDLAAKSAAERSAAAADLGRSLSRLQLTAIVRWDQDSDGFNPQQQAAKLLVCALLWHTQGRSDLLSVPRWGQLHNAVYPAGQPAAPAAAAAAVQETPSEMLVGNLQNNCKVRSDSRQAQGGGGGGRGGGNRGHGGRGRGGGRGRRGGHPR
jgi:hypothetical protein